MTTATDLFTAMKADLLARKLDAGWNIAARTAELTAWERKHGADDLGHESLGCLTWLVQSMFNRDPSTYALVCIKNGEEWHLIEVFQTPPKWQPHSPPLLQKHREQAAARTMEALLRRVANIRQSQHEVATT